MVQVSHTKCGVYQDRGSRSSSVLLRPSDQPDFTQTLCQGKEQSVIKLHQTIWLWIKSSFEGAHALVCLPVRKNWRKTMNEQWLFAALIAAAVGLSLFRHCYPVSDLMLSSNKLFVLLILKFRAISLSFLRLRSHYLMTMRSLSFQSMLSPSWKKPRSTQTTQPMALLSFGLQDPSTSGLDAQDGPLISHW